MLQIRRRRAWAAVLFPALLAGCFDSDARNESGNAQSCMKCHNGSREDDYSGPGMENPHPFPGADNLQCTVCHGGNGQGVDKAGSHVPSPPQIGVRGDWNQNRTAYFNRLTLSGLDRFPDYTVAGVTYSALDYLQFINPGDLRVVQQARSCGMCHAEHADLMVGSPLATSTGIFSGATFAAGLDNHIASHSGQDYDTAADQGFRAVTDPDYVSNPAKVGFVDQLIQYPVYSVRGLSAPNSLFQNQAYNAAALAGDQLPDGRVQTNSNLAHLYQEQVAFTCGDCHLGSAGANNRYGDFRSSGCTACHMRYSLSGRSGSQDPNVDRYEPIDPDDIDPPELSHLNKHRIQSVAKTLPNGVMVEGIDDYACAGCHQGSNRTVMQYWGIRLDQNQDVRNDFQYPANPDSYRNTSRDTRLFDPVVNNNTFNGRNANQYLLFEDYDGDGRDDTPADVHYDAGLGCIDCHGSYDLHGGALGDPAGGQISSRMEQAVAIRCENCHGAVSGYAPTVSGTAYNGQTADVAVDSKGNLLPHVVRESDGNYYLYSRLTGQRHFVKQTLDVIVDSGKQHPFTGQPVYNAKASYAMGRDDGLATTGTGPRQSGTPSGFSHTDNMDCASCHASWTNTCMGCHLEGEYDNGNNFSNITGDRIVFREKFAEFVYQSPVFFQLGVNSHNKITQVSSNTKVFFRYEDLNNNRSKVFAFSDRRSKGNNPPALSMGSLGHNAMMAHSIRGKVDQANEGPRYCVACHLTQKAINDFGPMYNTFRTNMANGSFNLLNFAELRTHFGQNPGNQLNSPLWVHGVAGLGTGLFLFDQDGCAVNPLDTNPNRFGCEGTAPATNFNPNRAYYNLDRIVLDNGTPLSSSNHTFLAGPPAPADNLRIGAPDPEMTGPLGSTLIQRLTDPNTGIVLQAWIDADGVLGGTASTYVQ